MKVLFISAVLPYALYSGGQVRIYNLLKRLSKSHEISLFSFIREERERQYEKELSFCEDVTMVMRGKALQPRYITKSLVGTYPWLLATYDNVRMRKALTSQECDLVHIEPFYVYPSLPKLSVPLVVSEHNIEYQVYGKYSPLFFYDVWKIKMWEERIWRRADHIIAVSDEDKYTIQKKTDKPVAVVPNGVDIEYFTFQKRKQKQAGPVLLFVGNFSWLPNREAAKTLEKKIWPRVRTAIPDAQIRIVGGGDVPDIRKEYQSADILVAPHRIAGGSKFKILESMASGLPVVTTKEGAKGLGVEKDVHYFEATTTEDYVATIEKVWQNSNLRDKVGRAARKFIEEYFDWDVIAKRQDEVWQQAYEKNH